jgi:hypothetical protein
MRPQSRTAYLEKPGAVMKRVYLIAIFGALTVAALFLARPKQVFIPDDEPAPIEAR